MDDDVVFVELVGRETQKPHEARREIQPIRNFCNWIAKVHERKNGSYL